MSKFNPNFLLFLIFSGIMISCSPKIGKYNTILSGLSVKPEILSLHQDSVRFTMEGAIPLEFLKKDRKIILYPEYVYGEGALRLGELVAFDGTFNRVSSEAKISGQYIFPYLEGMDSGKLVLKGIVQEKSKAKSIPQKEMATGLVTTALLARIGQITPDEPIPNIGVYMQTDFSDRTRVETQEFWVPFALGNSKLSGRGFQNSAGKNVVTLEVPGKVISQILVTGLATAEPQEIRDRYLAENRAKAVQANLNSMLVNKNTPVRTSARKNDWFDFRILLSDYKGISDSQKEAYYDVILSKRSFEEQLAEMRKLSSYNKVSRELFPKLRAAKITVTFQNSRLSDPEISANIFKLIQEGNSLDNITKENLAYAGQKAVRLNEKEAIYLKLVELYNSELGYNNLAVVYLNQAHRELDLKERNILISKAIDMIRQSNKLKTTSISMHNLGQAYLLRGDYFEAYVAISEASTLERNENDEFLRFNEGLRGAIDIVNGDYKLATIRLNRAPENEVNLFNKGLAHLLSDELRQALESFEESVQFNREYGYGFYGLALVAASTGDEQALYENLEKAVKRSEFLKARALRDVSFKAYVNKQEFRNIFK
ncbi:tetratricopeptide repeat protein [Rhodonellum sp.]|uniref:tetratricopeptide repeat protein n=1 Tax=Rhodonellum sp. TaxID=2231180 RepID=UPI00272425CF|nr:tetratricopeptide repeat protein [Rhodonellum sp.]MDO9551168.1 tetratricopeptide repeat protein [Rhodonellum sp.]